ncbi:MAG: aminotransferase class I/II-fold pyridoxal phosphate-dependent enzyme [Bacteroidota bacterium]|nr:aminotransferase class I/II-fold pyridoxal phosphate-dependent enzyme [Bacteroidota bacterium]
MGGKEHAYIQEAFESNWIAPVGPHITSFEKELSRICNDSSVAVLNSGTSAIHLALILLGVTHGDEVICSSFTFVASVNPIMYQGANPVFIDSEEDTWNMCPDLLEIAIKDRIQKGKSVKAIILVHVYGMPAKIKDIIKIANKYNIPIIEDAAEALGSTYDGQQLGTFGKFGIFSFNGNKIITTSGGGALLSKDHKLIDKAKFLATQARDEKPYYQHSEIGYNYRMSNICAGIGLGQLEILRDRVHKRREIFNFYRNTLNKFNNILLNNEPNKSFSNRWLTTILFSKESTIDKEQIRLHLEKKNIEARSLWKPMHLQPVFNKYKMFGGEVSEKLFDRGLCLPSGSAMNEKDISRVTHEIKSLYEK